MKNIKSQVNENQTLAVESSENLAAPNGDGQPCVAGRELDGLVAERVMGLVPCDTWRQTNLGSAGGAVLMRDGGCEHAKGTCYPRLEITGNIHGPIGGVPRFSTDIAAAMEVFEHLHRKGHMISVNASGEGNGYWCVVYPLRDGLVIETEYCDSLPEAICRAALQATASGEAGAIT